MSEPRYKRGKYKTYREKYHAQKESTIEEITELIDKIENFRTEIRSLKNNKYKSKVLENLQGLLDCLRKQERTLRKDKEDTYETKIRELEERINILEQERNQFITFSTEELADSSQIWKD